MNEYQDSARRREAIAQLVRSSAVGSQQHLRRLLRQRGFQVAQPTLSRDVRELGLAKTPRGYVLPDVVQFVPAALRRSKLDQALRTLALSVESAGALVVIKTPPAAAQPVARAVDEASIPGVAGTIAGDDTVFVATPSDRVARRLARRLLLAGGKGMSEAGA